MEEMANTVLAKSGDDLGRFMGLLRSRVDDGRLQGNDAAAAVAAALYRKAAAVQSKRNDLMLKTLVGDPKIADLLGALGKASRRLAEIDDEIGHVVASSKKFNELLDTIDSYLNELLSLA